MEKKVVLITGGSGGIGSECVNQFLNDGYTVCYTHSRSNHELIDPRAFKYQYVASREFAPVEELVKKVVADHGKLDVLVNNLGKTNDKLVMRMSSEDFCDVIDTNLVTVFNFSKAALKFMAKKKTGSIINVSSVVGVSGNMGQVNYSASKSAMYGMTKSFVKEYGRKNVRMNCISPGFINTNMTHELPEEVKASACEAISMKRMGEACEIANVIRFLASDDASYINGQNIIVDGGMV